MKNVKINVSKILLILIICLGCSYHNDYQRIEKQLQLIYPSLKLTRVYEQAKERILKKHFTPFVQKRIKKKEITVRLLEEETKNRGRYYPLFLKEIDIKITPYIEYDLFESILSHEICHKIWYEMLTPKQKNAFLKAYHEIDSKLKKQIDQEIKDCYSWPVSWIARPTEYHAHLAQVLFLQWLYEDDFGSKSNYCPCDFSRKLLETYKFFIKEKYLSCPQNAALVKIDLSFHKKGSRNFYHVPMSIEQAYFFIQNGGGLLRYYYKKNTPLLYLHYWVKPQCILIYDLKTNKIEKLKLLEYDFDIRLHIQYHDPAKHYLSINHRKIALAFGSIQLSLKDLEWLYQNGIQLI